MKIEVFENVISKENSHKGRKMTEVGLIPEDWSLKQVQEFTTVKAGGTPSTSIKEYWGGDIRWMNSGELNNKIVYEVENRITENGILNSATCLIPVNCVLIGLAGQGKTRGTVAINKVELCTNQSIAAVFPSNDVNPSYLYFNLDSRYSELRGLSTGDGGRGGLNTSIIKKLFIPLPNLKEQTAIATALSDADALIRSLEQLIEKKKKIKQGAMQELLRPKEGWERKEIGEFNFDISDGNYSSKYPKASEFKKSGVPFIRANNIKGMTVDENDMRYISNELHSELQKGHLKKGDILITTRGEIGQIAMVPESFIGSNINAQIVRINSENKLCTEYLAYYLYRKETQELFLNAQTGSALKQLPVNKLKKIPICFPSELEQIDISKVLVEIDLELSSLKRKLDKANLIKQGMMQNLLTGKIRLI